MTELDQRPGVRPGSLGRPRLPFPSSVSFPAAVIPDFIPCAERPLRGCQAGVRRYSAARTASARPSGWGRFAPGNGMPSGEGPRDRMRCAAGPPQARRHCGAPAAGTRLPGAAGRQTATICGNRPGGSAGSPPCPGPGPPALAAQTPKGQRGPTAAVASAYAGGRGRPRSSGPHGHPRRRRRRERPAGRRSATGRRRGPQPMPGHRCAERPLRGCQAGVRRYSAARTASARPSGWGRFAPGNGMPSGEGPRDRMRCAAGPPQARRHCGAPAAGTRLPGAAGRQTATICGNRPGGSAGSPPCPGPGPPALAAQTPKGQRGPTAAVASAYAGGRGRPRSSGPRGHSRRRRRRERPTAAPAASPACGADGHAGRALAAESTPRLWPRTEIPN